MTAKETLLALAERCEGATGADREIDRLIFCAISGDYEPSAQFDDAVQQMGRPGITRGTLRFTASLDAAMTLRTEGFGFEFRDNGLVGRTSAVASWAHKTLGRPGVWYASFAATPALALAAACLRARAASL